MIKYTILHYISSIMRQIIRLTYNILFLFKMQSVPIYQSTKQQIIHMCYTKYLQYECDTQSRGAGERISTRRLFFTELKPEFEYSFLRYLMINTFKVSDKKTYKVVSTFFFINFIMLLNHSPPSCPYFLFLLCFSHPSHVHITHITRGGIRIAMCVHECGWQVIQ